MKSFRRVRLMSFLLMALMTFSLTANTTPISAAESERNNGVKVMDRVRLAEKNRQKFLGDYQSLLTRTDPDLIAMKERLVYEMCIRDSLDAMLRGAGFESVEYRREDVRMGLALHLVLARHTS